MRVLVVNAGSSSVKLRLLGDGDELLGTCDLGVVRGEIDEDELAAGLRSLGEADAVGHRIVHGGSRYVAPVRVGDDVVRDLRALTELAPLHQPKSLAALDAVARARPELPAVACFDTAFHATLPEPARTYALPAAWRERWGLRRYGFHGLSHAYASRVAGARRVVVCHLGAGASLCAVLDGRSVDTTMGFTPLEGLVMATRSGDVDPGLLLWLLEREDVGVGEMAEALEHDSGLAGLAGTGDMREVVARAGSGDEAATLALEVYVRSLVGGIAAMAAALGGLDALVFTGGVGERSAVVRSRAAARLEFLGVSADAALNGAVREGEAVAEVSTAASSVSVLVVAAREDLEIARGVRSVLGGVPFHRNRD